MRFAQCVTVVPILSLVVVASAAQDPLLAVRDLYQAAAYEDVLVRLDTLKGSTHGAEEGLAMERYRALCLLALGRTAEAERAIEAVVTAAPSFRPSDADQSPRVRAAFRDVRVRALPAIIQQRYAQAKAAFDRHDAVAAKIKPTANHNNGHAKLSTCPAAIADVIAKSVNRNRATLQ